MALEFADRASRAPIEPSRALFDELREGFRGRGFLVGYQMVFEPFESVTRREIVKGCIVERGFFRELGIPLLFGRDWGGSSDSGAEAVILGERQWRDLGGKWPVEKPVGIDGVPYEVIGVAPDSATFPVDVGYWRMARILSPETSSEWTPAEFLTVTDASISRVESATAIRHLVTGSRSRVAGSVGIGCELTPIERYIGRECQQHTLLFLVAAVVVLLLAVFNVSCVALARLDARRADHAVQLALGAPRRAIVASIAWEIGILHLLALVIALPAAVLLLPMVVGELSPSWSIPRWWDFAVQPRAVYGVCVASLVSWLVIASVAVLYGLGGGTKPALVSARGFVGSRRDLNVRGGLLLAQQCLIAGIGAICLITCTSVYRAASNRLGVAPDRVAVIAVNASAIGKEERAALLRRAIADIGRIPSVEAVGLGWPMPGQPLMDSLRVRQSSSFGTFESRASVRLITDGTLNALQIPLLAGRSWGDNASGGRGATVLLDEVAVARLFPKGSSPIGCDIEVLAEGDQTPTRAVVVGVVAGTKADSWSSVREPTVYFSILSDRGIAAGYLFIRCDRFGRLPTVIEAAQTALHRVDRRLASSVSFDGTYRQWIEAEYWTQGLGAKILVVLSAVCIAIGLGGVYGLVRTEVEQRGREFAVRLALGATPFVIARLAVLRVVCLTSVGVVIGILAAASVAPVLAPYYPNVNFKDPLFYTTAAAAILVTNGVALLPPLVRLAKLHPGRLLSGAEDL